MGTRIKQFVLVAVLGVLLSIVFAGTASAAVEASFTMNPSTPVAGSPVTITDTTSNPDGYVLTYKWGIMTNGSSQLIEAGNSACLNTDCSQIQLTFVEAGSFYEISGQVSWPNNFATSQQRGTVVSPSEAPAPITLLTPSTVSLPTVLEVASPKSHMRFGGCLQPALPDPIAETCEPYLIKQMGRQADGLYHYRFRFATASPGAAEVTFVAWNDDASHSDIQAITFNVVASAYQFGDIRSCFWRKLKNKQGDLVHRSGNREVENVFDLYFYSTKDSRVIVTLQTRQDGRWVTKKTKKAVFSTHFGPGQEVYSPWARKQMRIYLGPQKPDRRISYEIKQGKKRLKRGVLSRQACTIP